MRKLSHLVNYDFDTDSFYRVDPSGQTHPTYINGEPLRHFKPNVTGKDYLVRRTTDLTPRARMSTLRPATLRTNVTLNDLEPVRGLQQSPMPQDSMMSSSKGMGSTKYSSRALQERSSAMRMLQVGQEQLSCQKSKQKAKKDLLNQTLSSYSKLLKQQIRTNHSPRGELPSCETPKDPLASLCTTIADFRTREPRWDLDAQPCPHKTVLQRRLQSNNSKRRKVSLQRALFKAMHPDDSLARQAKKQVVLRERKKNLKLLQGLFLRQGDRATRKIYRSIA